MISTQALKILTAIEPGVIAASATGTPIVVDTAGHSAVLFVLRIGATTVPVTVFKVEASDTSGGTYADIPGATLTSFPTATDDNKTYAVSVNLRDASIKRFMRVVFTVGAGTNGNFAVLAVLGDPTILPNTAAERGFAGEVLV